MRLCTEYKLQPERNGFFAVNLVQKNINHFLIINMEAPGKVIDIEYEKGTFNYFGIYIIHFM
jgi:hypothetical protein